MGGFGGTGKHNFSTLAEKEFGSISATGVIVEELANQINSIRISVEGSGFGNIVRLEGQVGNTWKLIGSIVGDDNVLFSVQAYDKIRISTLTYAGTPFLVGYKMDDHPAAPAVLADGSVNVNVTGVTIPPLTVQLDAFSATPDSALSVGSEDGTALGLRRVIKVKSDGTLVVEDSAVASALSTVNSSLTSIDGKLTTINSSLATINTSIGAGNTSLASIDSKLTTVNSNLSTINSSLGAIDSSIGLTNVILASIDAGIPASLGQQVMANSMPVVLASNQSAIPVSLSDEPVKISGTENGQPGGTEFTFVNNVRSQILAAKDRVQDITYADFGTKNQRVTQIDYTATSIGSGAGFTARKTLSYTLVGNRYRRDSIIWTLI